MDSSSSDARTKQTVFAIVTITIAIFIGLMIAEVALRVFVPGPADRVKNDAFLGTRPGPGGELDEKGFRNEQALTNADIVIFGDSQTYGNNASVEEAWPQVFGALTGQSVYQIAYGGWSPAHYRALFEEGQSLSPKSVIVTLYTGNDLIETVDLVYGEDAWEPYRSPSFSPTERGGVTSNDVRIALNYGTTPGTFAHSILSIRTWLRDSVRLYALLGNATRSLREKLHIVQSIEERSRAVDTLTEVDPTLGYIVESEGIETVLSPSYRYQTVNLNDTKTAEGWRLTKILLEEMYAKTRAISADFAIVIIPTKEHVYLSWMHETGQPVPEVFNEYEDAEKEFLNEIFAWCEENGIPCFNTTNGLVQGLTGGLRIYPDSFDGHPTSRGYSVIATEVYRMASTSYSGD